MTGQVLRRYVVSTLTGSAAYILLFCVASAAWFRGFENPHPGLFERMLIVWLVLKFILPGVSVGLFAPARPFSCGLIAYGLGLLVLEVIEVVGGYWFYHEHWRHFVTTWLWQGLLVSGLGGLVAYVTARFRRKRSSNIALDQARGQ